MTPLSAPADLSELIEAWTHSVQDVLELGLTCRDCDFDLPTQCPGWTVKDQISHVVGLEAVLSGEPEPQDDAPRHDWVRHEFGQYMETHVEARRGTKGWTVVAELRELIPVRQAQLHQMLADPDVKVPSPSGMSLPTDLLTLRVIDVWCHAQDIRAALDRPGNLDTPAAALFTQLVLDALPSNVARKADLPVGTVVIVESTGPLLARGGVRIIEQDGRPFGEALFSGENVPDHDDDDVTSIKLTTEMLTRAGAGRLRAEDLRYQVDGDEDVARAALEALVVTP